MTLDDLKGEYRLTSCGDDWGHCLNWWFHVADELYWRDVPLPSEWEFRPSPIGPQNEPDEYETECVKECDDETLLAFGGLLFRLAQLLKKLGKDY